MHDIATEKLILSDVGNTGLLCAFCHAIENGAPAPLLDDPVSVEIADRLRPLLAASPVPYHRRLATGDVGGSEMVLHFALRARRYDAFAREFLARNAGACVVNLGCGLDTRFWRVDDGRFHLYDLDLPATIALKRELVQETDRYHLLGGSVLDHAWMDRVAAEQAGPFLFLAEGLFMYLPEDGVRALVSALQARFPGCELVFESVNSLWLQPWLKWMIRAKLRAAGLGAGTEFHFGIREGRELEGWGPGIHFLEEWTWLDEDEPRIGATRRFMRWKPLRYAQWTVRYRLDGVTTTAPSPSPSDGPAPAA